MMVELGRSRPEWTPSLHSAAEIVETIADDAISGDPLVPNAIPMLNEVCAGNVNYAVCVLGNLARIAAWLVIDATDGTPGAAAALVERCRSSLEFDDIVVDGGLAER